MGRPWTLEEMKAAITKGPHVSVLQPYTMSHLHTEVAEKEKQNAVRVVLWEDLKKKFLHTIENLSHCHDPPQFLIIQGDTGPFQKAEAVAIEDYTVSQRVYKEFNHEGGGID